MDVLALIFIFGLLVCSVVSVGLVVAAASFGEHQGDWSGGEASAEDQLEVEEEAAVIPFKGGL